MINREVAQESFNLACKYYDDAKKLIRELTTSLQNVAPNFSYEVAMGQFDLILQGILLRTAMQDGRFLDEERQFIEKITDYGDIMMYYKKAGLNVTWETFNNVSDEDRKNLSLTMLVALKGIAENFIVPFALVDKVLPKDYCEELTKQISLICFALARCDDDDIESDAFEQEAGVAIVLVNTVIKEKWEEIVGAE